MNIRNFTIVNPFGNIVYTHKDTIYLYFFKIDQFLYTFWYLCHYFLYNFDVLTYKTINMFIMFGIICLSF